MTTIRTVLYVDDDPDIRLIASASLTQIAGWAVLEAAGADDAMRIAKQTRPDLVVLDAVMPGLDGLATMALLRTIESMNQVPMVFVTASDSMAERKRFIAAGAAGIVSKPFDPLTLHERILEALEPDTSVGFTHTPSTN